MRSGPRLALPFEQKVVARAMPFPSELDWSYIDGHLRPVAEIKDDPSIMKTLLRIQSSYRL